MHLHHALLLGAALALGTPGCSGDVTDLPTDLENWRTTTEGALNDLIVALTTTSGDWQALVREAISALPAEAQSLVGTKLQSVIARGTAQAGTELRCNADFLRDRALEGVRGVLARFLGQEPPQPQPSLCLVDPLVIDRELVQAGRVTHLGLFGYNFDQGDQLKVVHVGGGQTDVTQQLDRPTHYAATLDLGGSGVQLSEASERILIKAGDQILSTIAVIQPQTPVCASRVVAVDPRLQTFVPSHVPPGDTDFGGHGPKINASVTLSHDAASLRAAIYMHARETRSDWTTAMGTKTITLFRPEPGWRIDGVRGTRHTHHTYTDSDHDEDAFSFAEDGPVRHMTFVGDTSGSEAGTRTKVDVTFNRLLVDTVQSDNCVSALALSGARASLSEASHARFAAEIDRQATQRAQRLEVLRREAPGISE